MPVTCMVCDREFNSIGEVADHISETDKGMQGDMFAGRKEQMEEMRRSEKEMEHHLEAMRGFAHTTFRDKNGNLLSEEDTVKLYTTTMAGPRRCEDCGTNFPNNFRLAEHYNSTRHGGSFSEVIIGEFQELERKWF